MRTRILSLCLGLIALMPLASLAQPQTLRADSARSLPPVNLNAPLPRIEDDLRALMRTMMRSDDFALRLAAHQQLEAALTRVLERPESYDYAFDSLRSLIRLKPADNSFRVFTWMLIDPSGNHTYGGIVQRRLPLAEQKGAYEYIAIPLRDRIDMVERIETTPLDHENWLGALYYHPRNSEHGVLSFPGEFYRVSPSGKTKREKVTYYVLLGVNNHDARTNYKIVELIHFDPRDKRKVHFGVPVLYFGPTPRMRAVFKYADNANFTLNYAQVIEGKRRVPMIVFDHLAAPAKPHPDQVWTYGSDGTQDALMFFDRPFEMRRGFFGLRKNVTVYDPKMDGYDPDMVRAKSEKEVEKLRRQGMEYQSQRRQRP